MPGRYSATGSYNVTLDGVASSAPLPISPFLPAGATPVCAGGFTNNAVLTISIAAVVGRTAYLMGVRLFAGANAAVAAPYAVSASMSGLSGGFQCFWSIGTNGGGMSSYDVFPVPIPATGANTAISLTLPSTGVASMFIGVQLNGFYI